MIATKPTIAQEIGRAAIAFQRESTGIAPESVTVLLDEQTLVLTMQEALSPAERQVARTPEGAARVNEFHQRLFQTSAGDFHRELERILGVGIRESSIQMEPPSGRFVEVFPSGALVEVFLLGGAVSPETCRTPETKDIPKH